MKKNVLILHLNARFSEKAIDLYIKKKGLEKKDCQELINKLKHGAYDFTDSVFAEVAKELGDELISKRSASKEFKIEEVLCDTNFIAFYPDDGMMAIVYLERYNVFNLKSNG